MTDATPNPASSSPAAGSAIAARNGRFAALVAQDAANAAAAVLTAVSEGDLTPLEGATVMGLVENYRRVLETSEFEKRIEALEANRAT